MRACGVVFLMLGGCATHCPPPPAPPLPAGMQATPNFVDLQAGWRLRVITPILKGGGYKVAAAEESAAGNSVTVKTTPDFAGFETAYYAVRPAGIRFESATLHRDGEVSPQATPAAPLFAMPRGMRFQRLVYVTRVSKADHDMAAIGARDLADLAALTAAVLENPAGGCVSVKRRYCEWVPAGIAVRPEKRKEEGSEEWVAVR